MGEWKTIDTAPRDGTPVMLFSPQLSLDDPFNVDGGLVWVSGGYGKGVLGVWRGDSNKNPPTHWMPLPPPPKEMRAGHDWQPRGHMTIMGKPLVLHTCAKCSVIKEFTHESFWSKCWGDLVENAQSQGDNKPDGSGLDDGPYLPGKAPRKRAVKTADEKAATRRKAWETRRHTYGQKGHR